MTELVQALPNRYKNQICCMLHFVEDIAENVLILPANFFLGEDVESKFLQEKFGNALLLFPS